MEKSIKTGSDFSGVGAFDQALERLGIKQEKKFACDMDKYARQTYTLNFGKPEYYPTDVYEREIPKESLDIYMTSPPCQSFSLSGKRLGEKDKRGILFYNSHEFIKVNQPRFFIFENVKGLLSDDKSNKKQKHGKTFTTWLQYLGGKSINGMPNLFPHEEAVNYHIYYKVLNAKHYNIPQNRERIFIVGIRDDQDNVFSWPKPEVLNKRLIDVLENKVDEKYFLSQKLVNFFISNSNKQAQKGNRFIFRPKELSEISNSITTKSGSRMDDNFLKIEAIRGRNTENPKQRISGQETKQKLEINENGISNALTTVQKDNVVIGNLKGGMWDKNNGFGKTTDVTGVSKTSNPSNSNTDTFIKEGFIKQDTQASVVINENSISQTLCAGTHGYANGYVRVVKFGRSEEEKKRRKEHFQQTGQDSGSFKDKELILSDQTHYDTLLANPNSKKEGLIQYNKQIRRLTPLECFRLMDFNPSFKWDVSDTQAYKQAGNSICVGVLVAIISKLKL